MSWQALNWCAALHHVKGSRRALLWAMANRHNAKTGLITMGLSSIADESGLSRSFAHRQLKALEREGLIFALIPGSGTRPTAYQIPALASLLEGTQASVDNPIVERSSVPEVTGSSDLASPFGNLASPLEGMPYRIARAPKGNQEPNQRASTAPPDGGASRSQEPADAFGRDWRAALNGSRPPPATPPRPATQADTARDPDPTQPPSESSLPAPRAAASAVPPQAGGQARTATARQPRPRDRGHVHRGRKGRRGREPPARCTRSPATLNPSRKDPPWLTVNATR